MAKMTTILKEYYIMMHSGTPAQISSGAGAVHQHVALVIGVAPSDAHLQSSMPPKQLKLVRASPIG
jgi:hypothetical protein